MNHEWPWDNQIWCTTWSAVSHCSCLKTRPSNSQNCNKLKVKSLALSQKTKNSIKEYTRWEGRLKMVRWCVLVFRWTSKWIAVASFGLLSIPQQLGYLGVTSYEGHVRQTDSDQVFWKTPCGILVLKKHGAVFSSCPFGLQFWPFWPTNSFQRYAPAWMNIAILQQLATAEPQISSRHPQRKSENRLRLNWKTGRWTPS